MNQQIRKLTPDYALDIEPLQGTVTASRGDVLLASSTRARVMFETRLEPVVYFPLDDILVPLSAPSQLQTFCPFKGTASYRSVRIGEVAFPDMVWSYSDPLPESLGVEGYGAFMPALGAQYDLGQNDLSGQDVGHIGGPLVDWLLRDASQCPTPEALTEAFARKLLENGVSVSRLSVLIWSLHPLVAGKSYTWRKETGTIDTYAPSYEIHDHPAFVNSPLRHVSAGLGGVRQKLDAEYRGNSFPIIDDLRQMGATDYVAMPLAFSDGTINVLTLACDHPDGFSTANLGLVFECSGVISRAFEVFNQRENATALLETYVGRRAGARVLGGEIRRGDGDNIDAAIMFCDLRGSTRLEQMLGRDDYLAVLNGFFETVSRVVDKHEGEVLKFIGDAVLAVFPADASERQAKRSAAAAALQIVSDLAALDPQAGSFRPQAAIGLDFGCVTYGNVGSPDRLDFTVIGEAANTAARLADHAKTTESPIVASDKITPGRHARDLGMLKLRNLLHPVQAYALS